MTMTNEDTKKKADQERRIAALIPIGRYDARARVAEIELLANESTGNMFLKVPVEMKVGDATRVLEDHLYFTPTSAKVTAKKLYGYGANDSDFECLERGKWQELGANCNVEIEHEEYPAGSGVVRHRIKWVNRSGTVKVQTTKAALGSITQMLSGAFRSVVDDEKTRIAKRGGAPVANGGGDAPASRFAPDTEVGGYTPEDEDIPF